MRAAGRWGVLSEVNTCHLSPLAQRRRSLYSIVPSSYETFTLDELHSLLFECGHICKEGGIDQDVCSGCIRKPGG